MYTDHDPEEDLKNHKYDESCIPYCVLSYPVPGLYMHRKQHKYAQCRPSLEYGSEVHARVFCESASVMLSCH